MIMKKASAGFASLVLVALTACATLGPTAAPTQAATGVPAATGAKYYFVTNKLLLPTTQAQTQAFAVNVDGDPQNTPDNVFGQLLTLLASAAPGLDLQATLDQAVMTGQLVSLHAVKADNLLNAQGVSWSIFEGQKTQSAPKFDGSDKFTVDSAAPTNMPVIGAMTSGHFSGGPGTARILMYLIGKPVEVNLIGVHLEADLSSKGCANGKLGGGVTVDEFRTKLLPTIADGLSQVAKANPAAAGTLLQALDANHDGAITAQEIENNPMLMLAIAPDMDLLDASGNFKPGQDGVKDSYSVGLGFTCVPASFAAPGN
jgi:hypothetical protein